MEERRSLRLLTQSEIQCFRRCAREHHYRYRLLYRLAEEPEPMRFGTLVHVGIAAARASYGEGYRWPSGAAQTAMLRHMRAAAARSGGEVDLFFLARAVALVTGWIARWAADDSAARFLAVEGELKAPLVNPITGHASRTFELGGALDSLLAMDGEGRTRIVETKTHAGDIAQGSDYWQKLRLDAQVSAYYALARGAGHDVVGVLYDVLRSPGQRPLLATPTESRKYTKEGKLYASQRERDETPGEYGARITADIAEDPSKYYQRGTVVRLRDEEQEAMLDMWQTARMMREAELSKFAPRNPAACFRWQQPCSFFPVCTGQTTLSDPMYRIADQKHEELKGESTDAG